MSLTCIAVAGRRMRHLLAALMLVPAAGDLRSVAPYSAGEVAGQLVNLLLQSDRSAVMITGAGQSSEVFRAIETAGRPLGLSLVGVEAVERFAVLEDMNRRRNPLASTQL
jgi:hypothetical protein